MKKSHRFPTGSRFDGTMNQLLHCMEGFGVYLYPDGSEYRGYFRNGKFHGFGRLKLASPYKVTFKGVFEDGALEEIETMTFADGLHFQGTLLDNGEFDMNEWRYCTGEDRRYSTEIQSGLEAVGPNSFLTRMRPARRIAPRLYDIEEGTFRPGNGFVWDRPPPFKPYRFVACDDEVDFIRAQCRVGPRSIDTADTPLEPMAEHCRFIIDANLEAMKKLGENMSTCTCNDVMERKRIYPHLRKPVGDPPSDNTSDLPQTPSSQTLSSFTNPSLVEDVTASCQMEMTALKAPLHIKKIESDENGIMERRNTAIPFASHFKQSAW